MRIIRNCCAWGLAVIVWLAGLAATALVTLGLIGVLTRDHPGADELTRLGYYLMAAILLILVAGPLWFVPARAVYRKLHLPYAK